MERLQAVAHAQPVAELTQASAGEPVTRGEPHVFGFDPPPDLVHKLAILGKGLVVASAALEHPGVGGAVDVVDRSTDRRQAAREERLAETFGRDRQVRQDAEAAEALAENAPAVDVERGAEELGVADDRVGPEVREVVHLLLRCHPVERSDRRRAAGSALVEQEHAELGERTRQELRATGCRRARSLVARATLEEHEERPVGPVRRRHLAREHGDPLAVESSVVERRRELVLGDDEPRDPVGRLHAAILPQTPPLSRTRRRPESRRALLRLRVRSSAPTLEARTRSAARRRRRRPRRS